MKAPYPFYQAMWMMAGKLATGPHVATGYDFSGPGSGTVGTPSGNFTVTLSPMGGTVTGTVTITPSDSGGGGTFTPSTVGLTTGAPSATFTYTAGSSGTKTLSCTNNGGLTNPANLSYVASAGVLSDGDPVSSWSDSSGNGHTATMTGSNRPIYKTGIVGGKPVVRFTSAGFSKLDLATSISGAGNLCVFAVFKATGPTVNCIGLIGNTAAGLFMPVELSGALYFCDRINVYNIANDFSGAFHVFGLQTSTAPAGSAAVDGTGWGVGTSASANSNNFTNIGYRAVDSLYSDGDIAELVIYNVNLGVTDRDNVTKGLCAKYSITYTGAAATAVDPSTVAGLVGWWKADSL